MRQKPENHVHWYHNSILIVYMGRMQFSLDDTQAEAYTGYDSIPQFV
jgi:hypothetical protein